MADSGESSSSNGVKVADRASERAAFLAGSWGTDEKEETKQPVERDDADDAEDDQGDEELDLEVDLDEADLADGEEEETDDEDEDEEADEKKPDADTSKRLDAVRRREQRSREQLATERKSFEKERDAFISEWKPKIEAAEKFEALKGRGVNAFNALDVLRELGLEDSDLVQASRNLYAASADGKADPKNAEAIARLKKERERDDELKTLRKKLEDREAAEKAEREQAAQARAVDSYLDGIEKAAPEGSLAKHFLVKQPKATRAMLGKIAFALAEKNGAPPSAKQVNAFYEKARAKQLRALGVDPTTIAKAAPVKGATAKTGDKKTAKQTTDTDEPLTKAAFVGRKTVS